jgi:hypothetical protein
MVLGMATATGVVGFREIALARCNLPGAYGTNSAEQIAAQTTCPRGLEYGGLFAWSLRMEC